MIDRLKSLIPLGSVNAVSMKYLSSTLNISTSEVKHMIDDLLTDGIMIVCDLRGIYFPNDRDHSQVWNFFTGSDPDRQDMMRHTVSDYFCRIEKEVLDGK